MADTNNWTDRESAARRRILLHLARTSQSPEEFGNFISDMEQLMPIPGELLVEAASEFSHQLLIEVTSGFDQFQENIFNQRQAAEDYNSTTSSSTAEQDDNPSSRKKTKTEEKGLQPLENDDTLNLHDLYAGDMGALMISYTSASDLCKLDLLNKQFQRLTGSRWEALAYERFGMSNGKDSWRAGTALLREPVFIHIDRHPIHGGMKYPGVTSVSSNNSLIALDTDAIGTDDRDGDDCAPFGINLYDATDLIYLGLGPGEGGGRETILAGPTKNGDNVFITVDMKGLSFYRRDIIREFSYAENASFTYDYVPLIASETHVIAINGCTANLYRIVSNNDLVELCGSEPLQTRKVDRENDEYYYTRISWGVDESEFIIYSSVRNLNDDAFHTSKIIIFGLDAMTDTISPMQTFSVSTKLREITLGKDFIAGSCEFKKIHVWDRHTQQKKHDSLCDTEEIDGYDPEVFFLSIELSCQGHMLISTSHRGIAICIWDMKTGQLLKRHNHAEEEGVVTMLTDRHTYDEDDAFSMAYTEPLNCYICMSEYMNVWSFPTNQQQMDNALMIREREEEVRRNDRLVGRSMKTE